LGSEAETFATLAAAGVSFNGTANTVNGNVGSFPTNTITGFPAAVVVTGGVLESNAVSQAAQGDALTAYNFLAGQGPATIEPGIIGNLTLLPGVYDFSSTAELTGTLTLDAEGSDNAVFIFQVGSSLTLDSSAQVLLTDGGPDDGVFWQVAASATLGDSSVFDGNILALTSITLDPSADIACGRALAGINQLAPSGAITLAGTNTVDVNNGTGCVGGYGGGYESADVAGGFERISNGTIPIATPEPASLAILVSGLVGLGVTRRRKRMPMGSARN
jgi:hypothetical protein